MCEFSSAQETFKYYFSFLKQEQSQKGDQIEMQNDMGAKIKIQMQN